ncbi:lysozyme inhibitor LprI family protein [Pseudomonas sp. KNUC1026]|uniref:lysozyme inhibitor LprI family protein n=1 Tax=Pseudomonas sp. KNUC1026 TaxID=2893890 RepID=UPI001F28EBB1|nr:lysozyme inhibitor LprI family protein [Pseudomonas sp. KNUC1026]UFH49374.1 lysozyme inhibitor LprI family protein [Pseudomonas sp. KNUC1026]
MLKLIRPALSAILLASACSAAQAAQDCSGAVSTVDMQECAQKSLKAADADLNMSYQKLLKRLSGSSAPGEDNAASRRKLINAQKAWIAFRDADCDAQYQAHIGGTLRGLVLLGCKQQHTEQRTKELDNYLPN